MKNITVAEYLEAAQESEDLQRKQIIEAGTILSQFLLVREGLAEKVEPHQIDAIAATLTVGIYSGRMFAK
jgi:hypothetical protein